MHSVKRIRTNENRNYAIRPTAIHYSKGPSVIKNGNVKRFFK